MAGAKLVDRLLRRAARAGVELSPDLATGLAAYFTLLSRWNARINLTSLGADSSAIDRLIVEPIVAARHVRPGCRSMLDVGSGSGSPAIPLKLVKPGLALTMVESKARKAAFLREVARALTLSETRVESTRFEDLLVESGLREAFDLVTLRAVRVDRKLLGRLQAALAPGGQLMLFRGPSPFDAPSFVDRPLKWVATIPLLASLSSQLVLLVKVDKMARSASGEVRRRLWLRIP